MGLVTGLSLISVPSSVAVFIRVVMMYTTLAVTSTVRTTIKIIELVSKCYVFCKVMNPRKYGFIFHNANKKSRVLRDLAYYIVVN